jgi:fatty-acid desaturase
MIKLLTKEEQAARDCTTVAVLARSCQKATKLMVADHLSKSLSKLFLTTSLLIHLFIRKKMGGLSKTIFFIVILFLTQLDNQDACDL